MTGLPIVDVAPLLAMTDAAALARTAAAIEAAARRYGFFYAEGHGIPPELFARLEAVSHRFFALSEADKAAIGMEHGGRAWRGWFPLGGELTSWLPDRKEGLYLGEELGPDDPRVAAGWPLHGGNLWPEALPELRPAIEAWLAAALPVASALARGMALALGLDARYFETSLTANPTMLFRIFHFPAGRSDDLGVGEHTDYGFLTLLAQDRHGGLELKHRDGSWLSAPPRDGALVINLGDMFERLTRGRFRSAPHRVINRSGQPRLSFPLFFDPDFAATIEPLPTLASETARHVADAPRWDGRSVHDASGTYGDYLVAKVGRVFPDLSARPATSSTARPVARPG